MNRPPPKAGRVALLTLLWLLAGLVGAAGQGMSGLYPLFSGVDALAVRLILAEQARRTIDAQYYIWRSDVTGRLLIHRMLLAADRGVRVRILLDDIGTAPNDEQLLALDAHANIEVRLFNPVEGRKLRGLSALIDFQRINRRMHNKSFTVDGRFTVVGGRNIGDEYFSADPALEFADLDVLARGAVVGQADEAFELYWNCPAAASITRVSGRRLSDKRRAALRRDLAVQVETTAASAYASSLDGSTTARQLRGGVLEFRQAPAWLVCDDPSKIDSFTKDAATHLVPRLRPVMAGAAREALVVSPYFIPGTNGVEFFRELRARGVRVAVLTNSLATTDVPAVHSGYQRYRKPLLRSGVELYEMRRTSGATRTRGHDWIGSSSAASLHAKTFILDRHTVFVGSLNLDPRSIDLNTETGLMFDSPELALLIAQQIEHILSTAAYRVELDQGLGLDRLRWSARSARIIVRANRDPDTTWFLRFRTSLLSLLPIEGQL